MLNQIKSFLLACLFIICFFLLILILALFNILLGEYIPILIIAGILALLVLIYIYGIMIIITFYYNIKDYRKCKLLLRLVIPTFLLKPAKPYYYLYSGFISALENKTTEAENYCRTALKYGFKSSSDNSLAYLFLSEILLNKGYADEAKVYLESAKNISHHEDIEVIIKNLEDRLRQANSN